MPWAFHSPSLTPARRIFSIFLSLTPCLPKNVLSILFFISGKSDGHKFSISASAILVTVLHARFRIPWDREINLCQEGVTVVFASDLRSRNINHVSHSACFVFFNARQISGLTLHSHFQFMGCENAGMRTFSHFTRPERCDGGILHYKTGTVWFIFFTDSRGNVRVTSEVGNSRRRKIASSWENLIPFFHCSIPFCPIITIVDLTWSTSFPRKGASHDLCVAPIFFINRFENHGCPFPTFTLQ